MRKDQNHELMVELLSILYGKVSVVGDQPHLRAVTLLGEPPRLLMLEVFDRAGSLMPPFPNLGHWCRVTSKLLPTLAPLSTVFWLRESRAESADDLIIQ